MPDKTTEPVGQIVGAFGIRGQVKVEPTTAFVERMEKGTKLKLGDDWHTVESFAIHKGRPLLKLSGIETMSEAQALQWKYLEAPEERPDLDDDEFVTDELIGLDVFTLQGENLGKVDEVMLLPAQDVLQVGEIMIPIVKQFVKSIDLKKGRITVELIPGMRPGEDD